MVEIEPAEGKLGVLLVGLGAVSTTFIAGVEKIRRGEVEPIGSLTQMQTIRLERRDEKKTPKIKDFVPLANLKDIVFGAWDIFPDNAYVAAKKAGVLNEKDLGGVKDFMEGIKPMKGIFDPKFIRNIDGENKKNATDKRTLIEEVRNDTRDFKKKANVSRLVCIWAASTEIYMKDRISYDSLEAFEKALDENDPDISPCMLYAYALLKEKVPFAHGAPHMGVDIPALVELAKKEGVAICGKDFKTGQTLMKTLIAPGFKMRMLGVRGWFSTNILGNRDGLVLDDPQAFRSKEITKASALDYIFQPEMYPELYKGYYHKVRINYYPPKGDDKEGWDHIDIFGWLGYNMQIKVNFLCKDSILAAPIVLDLALFMDLAQRAGLKGIQEWLSFYFKSPLHAENIYPEHDLFIQHMKLKNMLRHLKGEELITHLGLEYYD